MDMRFGLFGVALLAALSLPAQTLSNKSLSGKYYFRELLIVTDTTLTLTLSGTMAFDANGAVAISGQSLSGTGAPAQVTVAGTYSVDAGGIASITDALRSGAAINARLGQTALVGSTTEAGNSVFSIFVAVPAATA